MNDDARAAVLASALSVAPLDPAEILARLRVAPIRRILPAIQTPLDLRARVFRYRVTDEEIIALREGGRVCQRPAHRRS